MMDFNQIQEIIRMVSKHKLTEFSLKEGDFRLVIRNQQPTAEAVQAAPIVLPAPQQVVATPAAAPIPPPLVLDANPEKPAQAPVSNLLTIKSPMVGTFYRSAGPDKPPFIKVGDTVDIGAKVCIIEAMKLFNEIESEVKGKIVKVLAEDASPVEYDQPLFLVEPG
jgi:acetyl-CoA carboxylase biotin carboxyl carrier protein